MRPRRRLPRRGPAARRTGARSGEVPIAPWSRRRPRVPAARSRPQTAWQDLRKADGPMERAASADGALPARGARGSNAAGPLRAGAVFTVRPADLRWPARARVGSSSGDGVSHRRPHRCADEMEEQKATGPAGPRGRTPAKPTVPSAAPGHAPHGLTDVRPRTRAASSAAQAPAGALHAVHAGLLNARTRRRCPRDSPLVRRSSRRPLAPTAGGAPPGRSALSRRPHVRARRRPAEARATEAPRHARRPACRRACPLGFRPAVTRRTRAAAVSLRGPSRRQRLRGRR